MAAIQGDWYASAGAPNEAYPERDGTVRFVYADQPNGDRYIVAKVWAGDDQDYESTARLVAAAPELLDAMRGSLAFLDWASEWRERDATAVDQEIAFEIGRIKRAIAKAEGRSE